MFEQVDESPIKAIHEESSEEQNKHVSLRREKISLLAIAYYNAGAQLEFMKSYHECIDSFNRAISILEKNFAPNYPLTLEFKKTLSKAIEKYQTHLSWKGYKRTFTNLNESYVTRRVVSSNGRPTSAVSVKNRTQPMQGRFRRLGKVTRPTTAKTKHLMTKNYLNDSINNPFGSPDDKEECLFSLEEQPKEEGSTHLVEEEKPATKVKNIEPLGALNRPVIPSRSSTISPMFAQNRNKRPQSAKTAFGHFNQLKKKSSTQDYATLQLREIFAQNPDGSVKPSQTSYSSLSKPPIARNTNGRKRMRPELRTQDQFESIVGMYNSDIDPKTTVTSFHSKRQFGFTAQGKNRPVRPMIKEPLGLKAYKSIDVRRPN